MQELILKIVLLLALVATLIYLLDSTDFHFTEEDD